MNGRKAAAVKRISVVMTTFNGGRYLEPQLESIMGQSTQPDEVVIADDGSTDGTPRIITDFIRRSPPSVDVSALPPGSVPLGVTRNYERGLRHATGDLILLADQDDVWERHRIEAALEAMYQRPDALLYAWDAELIDARGKPLGCTQFGAMKVSKSELEALNSARALEALVRRNVLPGMTFAFRRELLAGALPIPDGWMHDYFFACLAGARCALSVSDCSRHLRYRQHPHNLVGARPSNVLRRVVRGRPWREEAEERSRMFAVLRESLEERAVDVPTSVLSLLSEKARFETTRCGLPRGRCKKASRVWSMVRNGQYRRFSSADLAIALRDVACAGATGGVK